MAEAKGARASRAPRGRGRGARARAAATRAGGLLGLVCAAAAARAPEPGAAPGAGARWLGAWADPAADAGAARWLVGASTTAFVGAGPPGAVNGAARAVADMNGRVFVVLTGNPSAAELAVGDPAALAFSEAGLVDSVGPTWEGAATAPALSLGCANTDPEDPTCAKLTLSGTVAAVTEAELSMAVTAMEKRHPDLPWDKEEWAIVELEVEEGFLVDIYGGAHLITPELYYSTAPKRPHLPWCPHLPLGLCLPWCSHAQLAPPTPRRALTQRPDPSEPAALARWLAAGAVWGAMATTSQRKGHELKPFSNIVSAGEHKGRLFFYGSTMDPTWTDIKADSVATLVVTEDSFPSELIDGALKCRGLDVGDMRCASATFQGALVLTNDVELAKATMFAGHPQMKRWPKDHKFKFYELVLNHVTLVADLDGAREVALEDYWRAGQE